MHCWHARFYDDGHLMTVVSDVSRPVSLGPPASLQSSLGQKPWNTRRPSGFTAGRLAQLRSSMPTGSPLTALPSPLPVKALPPLPHLLTPPSPIDQGSDQR